MSRRPEGCEEGSGGSPGSRGPSRPGVSDTGPHFLSLTHRHSGLQNRELLERGTSGLNGERETSKPRNIVSHFFPSLLFHKESTHTKNKIPKQP